MTRRNSRRKNVTGHNLLRCYCSTHISKMRSELLMRSDISVGSDSRGRIGQATSILSWLLLAAVALLIRFVLLLQLLVVRVVLLVLLRLVLWLLGLLVILLRFLLLRNCSDRTDLRTWALPPPRRLETICVTLAMSILISVIPIVSLVSLVSLTSVRISLISLISWTLIAALSRTIRLPSRNNR